MRLRIDDGEGRIHETIVIRAEVCNHWVFAGARHRSEEAAGKIIDAQVLPLICHSTKNPQGEEV